jgi:glycolate oxidase iron-sulfur subunit
VCGNDRDVPGVSPAPGFGILVRRGADRLRRFLATVEPVAQRHPIKMRVAYHDACQHAHAQRIRARPRALLRGIPELELLEISDG